MSKDTFTLEQIEDAWKRYWNNPEGAPMSADEFLDELTKQEPKFSEEEADMVSDEFTISLPEEIQVGDRIVGINFRPEGGRLQWVQVEPGVWEAVMSDEYNNGQEG